MPAMETAKDPDELPGLGALDGAPGPALALGEAELRALVASTLEKAQLGGPKLRVLRWRRTPGIVLAVVAMTTAAAAYRGERVVAWLRDTAGTSPSGQSVGAARPSVANPAAPERAAPSAAEAPPLVVPPAPVPGLALPESGLGASASSSVSSVPMLEAKPRRERAEARAARPRRTAVQTSSPSIRAESASPPEASVTSPVAQPDPEREGRSFEPEAVDTLARANAARGARRYSEALESYSRVVERYPSTLQAQAARVAAAALSLEQFGDTKAAERLYLAAAARGGALGAEARHGLADVYRARGDTASERAALVELLRAHPQSPLARSARARLAELHR